MDIYNKQVRDNIFFTYQKDDKYNSNYYSLSIVLPLLREEAPLNALFPYILLRGSKNYNTYQQINYAFDNLMGTDLGLSILKKGKYQIIQLNVQALNEQLGNKDITKKIVELINELLFNPLVENSNQFKDKYFNQEKQKLIDKIKATADNKMSYVVLKCIEKMFNNQGYGISKLGSIDTAEEIINSQLYTHYKNIFNKCQFHFFACGADVNIQETEDFLLNVLKGFQSRDNVHKGSNMSNEMERYDEAMNIEQAKIAVGMKVRGEDYQYLDLFNTIYGDGSSSKLFKYIREKESLAYYTFSQIDSIEGIVIATAGINARDNKKVESLIRKGVEDISNGEISEEELTNAKKTLINNYISALDNPWDIGNFYLANMLKKKSSTIQEEINRIEKANVEDIKDIANRISITTIYNLIGKEEKGCR